jgi:hypothetical protein
MGINVQKLRLVTMFRPQNARKNHTTNIGNKSFENVTELK